MIVIDTLGALREGGYRLFAHCEIDHTCLHSAVLDLDVLIERFGEDFPFIDRRDELARALVCARCGRRGAVIRLHPPLWSIDKRLARPSSL